MKKNILFIGLAVAIGVLLGWLIFSNPTNETNTSAHDYENESVEQLWTCSMHPQIMQPEPGDCPICGMDLIPAESSSDGLSPNEISMTENAMALANIQTSIVGSKQSENSILKLSGTIKADEDKTHTQSAHFNGRIEKLYVKSLGETVNKGQALAVVYAPELVSAQQELITAYKIKDVQPGLYNAVRNKLKNWMISDKYIDEIISSGTAKSRFTLHSHVSGVVTSLNVSEGGHMMDGMAILQTANLNTVWGVFDAYEKDIQSLEKNQNIIITSNAFPDKTIEGTISYIDPILDNDTRTVEVRTVINNKDNKLKPGMFIEASVKIDPKLSENSEIKVPSSAVMWTGKRSLVYVKTSPDKPIFEMREVSLGKKFGTDYAITSGLKSGEEIVTNGTFTVDAAAQLQGKKSMMNKSGGKTTTGHEGHLGIETDNNKTKNLETPSFQKFQNQLLIVLNSYIVLKDALVNDDYNNAKDAANSIENNLNKIDLDLLKNKDARNTWTPIQKELQSSVKAIANASEIKEQRKYFKDLSDDMIKSLTLYGVHKKAYTQFCPMVDNNNGASWLSFNQEISNPYYGKEMSNCGEVIQTFE